MSDKVLATVAGREIKESDIQNVIVRQPAERRAQFESPEAKKQLLEQMISFELFNVLGQELNIDKTEDYKVNVEQAQKDILTQLTINKIMTEVTVTDEDALKFYNENEDKFKDQATATAKHILVDSEELCKEVKTKIDANELSFEDAAAQYSSCPSAEQGGALGSFGKGMMVPEFENVAFTLDLNTISEPVKTQFGYHLIKVEDRTEGSVKSFEEVKDQIVGMLLQQMQERKYLDVVKGLESKFGVSRV